MITVNDASTANKRHYNREVIKGRYSFAFPKKFSSKKQMDKISSEALGFYLYKRRDHESHVAEGRKEEPIKGTFEEILCDVLVNQ
jgi:hypothetical protein